MMSAIFLLVTLAALGTFMVSFSTVQHATSAMDVQGSRAYQAARAGIEWGVYQVLRNSSCAASTPLTLAGDLAGFTVTATCGASPAYTEGAASVTVYTLTATASQGTPGSIGYAERQVRATVAK